LKKIKNYDIIVKNSVGVFDNVAIYYTLNNFFNCSE